jgi:hypothetical protein
LRHDDAILEFLQRDPTSPYCDDCLGEILAMDAAGTVDQVARRLAREGRLRRGMGNCAACGAYKLVTSQRAALDVPTTANRNRLTPKVAAAPAAPGPVAWPGDPRVLDIEKMRNEVVHWCQQLWRSGKTEPVPRGVTDIIRQLREGGVIPTHIAQMMLSLCYLRNAHVYEGQPMGHGERMVAAGAWEIAAGWWAMRQAGKKP